ncbi:MAG: methyl-accepting chemotaxis protein [Acidiferrobacteraceae bacterium]
MEMFYAKGLSLRVKIIASTAVLIVLFTAGGLAGLHVLARLAHALAGITPGVAHAGVSSRALLDDAMRSVGQARLIMATGIGSLALVSIGFAVYLVRAVAGPLARLTAGLQKAAQGDFTVSIFTHRRDEIGQAVGALNMLVDELNQSMIQVSQSAESVANGSRELSSAAEQLSAAAQEQASSLEETAASMEEMTGTVKQNADNALRADSMAIECREAANEGVVMSSTMRRSMNGINDSSKRIADIIGVIDEIAFQTNILALNAAVEAARAGDQGRGFAVVAAEVRSLAQRSASAAKEIKELIKDSVEKVQDGVQLVTASATTLQGIVESVKNTAEIIGEISASSQEQASGIEQVNRAVMQMDGVTQSNAAQVEELSGTSQSLAAQAQQLQALVAQFTLSNTAAPRAAAPARAAETKPAGFVKKHDEVRSVATKVENTLGDWTEF